MTERLARAMWQRRCDLDHAQPALAELAWHTDPGIRAFWIAEAAHVIALLDEWRT
jgi:hypothetical protein